MRSCVAEKSLGTAGGRGLVSPHAGLPQLLGGLPGVQRPESRGSAAGSALAQRLQDFVL